MATRAAQAIRGPPVRGGATVRRQSMPSSNTASCAAVNCSAPSTIGGQTNLPFSSRLANRHRPEPSQVKSSRSRRACRGRRRPLPRTDRRREPAPPPPTPVEAAPHVDGLAGEIDFERRTRGADHRSLSVESTRRRTSRSTLSSMRTCAPLGRRTSIAPSHAALGGSCRKPGAPSISAGVSVGAARCSATRRIGTNLGVSLASRDELVAAGVPSPAPQRRSGQPFRERRIHLKTRFALTPFTRATPATDAPGVRAASTIRRRSAALQDRRFLRAP